MLFNFEKFNNQDFANFKNDLKNNGYIILRDVISLSFLNKLEREILSITWSHIKKAEINVIQNSKVCALSSSHNLVEYSNSFEELYENNEISMLFEKIIGTKPNSNLRINSSYFFKKKESGSIKLHQDNAYFNLIDGNEALTFYVPIHYQSRKVGTIYYYSGSHNLGFLNHVPNGNLGASMCLEGVDNLGLLKKYKIDYLELQPGDLVAHNALVVHGTLPNPKDIPCEAFNFTLFSERNEINDEGLLSYKTKLKKFLENCNNKI